MQNLFRRARTVNKKHVMVSEAVLRETSLIVHLVVESNDSTDTELTENRVVILRYLRLETTKAIVPISEVGRTGEGDKLARHNNVEVAVLDALVFLILRDIEERVGQVKVDKTNTLRLRYAVDAVEHSEITEREPTGCISKGRKWTQLRDSTICRVRLPVLEENQISTEQHC